LRPCSKMVERYLQEACIDSAENISASNDFFIISATAFEH